MEAHGQKNPVIRGYEPMGETTLDSRVKAGTSCFCMEGESEMLIYGCRSQGVFYYGQLPT